MFVAAGLGLAGRVGAVTRRPLWLLNRLTPSGCHARDLSGGGWVLAPTLAHHDGLIRSMSAVGIASLRRGSLQACLVVTSHPGPTPATTSVPASEENIVLSSVTTTVADFYRFVVGVDTHAATHSYAIVAAPNGALIDQATFPTTPAGLRRARDWIGRRTRGDLDGVLVAAEGTVSYGAVLSDVLEEAGYRVVEAPTPRRERGRGKTDSLDAVLAARSTLVVPLALLRDRRAGESHTALQVLTVARDQLNADRLRCINALTALVRTHDLGVDARRALTTPQISTIAGWRRRDESLGVATARAQAVRLAKRILVLDDELADNRDQITEVGYPFHCQDAPQPGGSQTD